MIRCVKGRDTIPVQKCAGIRKSGTMKGRTAAEFLGEFCARVRAAREARGLTQAEMAAALGVGGEAYRAYEKRTPVPHYLIERFARIAGVDIEYLFTGRQPRDGGKGKMVKGR
jgi:DNA-binding XRE family transcriptional regulator